MNDRNLSAVNDGAVTPLRVCFFFNAQKHQLLHGVSIAAELARRPGFEVQICSPSPDHIAYARQVVSRLGEAPIQFSVTTSALGDAIRTVRGSSVPPKVLSIGLLARKLNRFDAIAIPERTSLLLKRMGATSPKYIHLDHGAGDRAVSYDPRIADFDMVLMAGEKHRGRLLRDGIIKPGRYAVVGYPKFDAADAIRGCDWSPFDNGRKVVLYNPHFTKMGSWDHFGLPLLHAFASQDRYNLIVAPHVRMLDNKKTRERWLETVERFSNHPHIFIDTGSHRSIDMTYTSLADVYVGDVSSQVYEFLRRPGPCVFLDAHDTPWEGNEDYLHWQYGPVVRSKDCLIEAIDKACASHAHYIDAQRQGFGLTFDADERSASDRAATAIADFLTRSTAMAKPPRAVTQRRIIKSQRFQRAAAMLLAITAGWMARDALGPLSPPAAAASFAEEAIAAHQATRIRAMMRSQPEVTDYDAAEIRKATGISMPALPATWKLTNVQVYPSDAGPMVQLALRTEVGEPITFVISRLHSAEKRRPALSSLQGEHIAYWEEDAQAYGIVGGISAQRLLTLAAMIDRDS